MDNLQLWHSVERTDPDMTKRVEVGRKFTAIDAHYQVLRATEMFGPAGYGWGTRNERFDTIICDPNDAHFNLLKYQAVLWYQYRNSEGEIIKGELEIAADIELFNNTKQGWKRQDDPVKKVRTDALTKGLSWLGFNADVFMGKFDNQKYVQELQQEKRQQAQQQSQANTQEMATDRQKTIIEQLAAKNKLAGADFAGWLRGSYGTSWSRLTASKADEVIKGLKQLLDEDGQAGAA